jgi:hypothetical protein
MTRLLRSSLAVVCAGLLACLPAVGQNAPAAPATAPPGPRAPFKPKNLKVLPQDTDLRKVMRQYSGDLGVECEFCHTAAPDPVTHHPDRASDANPMKDTARYMITMTDDLNNNYLAQLPGRMYADPITCGTCHRGEKHPSIFVPPPRQEGSRPAGAPPAATAPSGTPQTNPMPQPK